MTTRAPAVLKKPLMGHLTNTDTFDAEVWIESSGLRNRRTEGAHLDQRFLHKFKFRSLFFIKTSF